MKTNLMNTGSRWFSLKSLCQSASLQYSRHIWLQINNHEYSIHNPNDTYIQLLETREWQVTFNAIPKQAWRFCGRPKIKLHIAPRPWVTRSISRIIFPLWSTTSEKQRSFKIFKADSGKSGTSPRSLLKDLSEAGKDSNRDLA